MKTVLLVEDDEGLGQTLRERLQKEGYRVEWARRLEDARHILDQQQIHLFILDVGLPDGSGFEFAQMVRQDSSAPFIFLTAQSSAEDRLRGYELGASEYIPKPFLLKELLLRVRHVFEDHQISEPYRVGGVEIDFESMTVRRGQDSAVETLAKKETDLLRLLVLKSPKVVSRDEILNELWGSDKFPTNRTVDNLILRLRQALGPECGGCIRSVRGVGYQWNEEEVNNGK